MILFYCKVIGCSVRLLEHQCKEHLIAKHGIKPMNDYGKYFTWIEIEI